MSKYIIAAQECDFFGIPYPTLQDYGPITATWLCLFRAKEPLPRLYLKMHLNMLAHISAIDRLHQYDLDDSGNTAAALFDFEAGTTRLLQDLENYLRILCGTDYLLIRPWARAKNQEEQDRIATIHKMDEELIKIYQQTPRRRPQCGDILRATLATTEAIADKTYSDIKERRERP